MQAEEMTSMRPFAAAGAVWDVTDFRVRAAAEGGASGRRTASRTGKKTSVEGGSQVETGAFCRCEVEVLERQRQFYRSFVLHYQPEWFEVWEREGNDYAAVADHARRWIATYLTFSRQKTNLSGCERPYIARIYW